MTVGVKSTTPDQGAKMIMVVSASLREDRSNGQNPQLVTKWGSPWLPSEGMAKGLIGGEALASYRDRRWRKDARTDDPRLEGLIAPPVRSGDRRHPRLSCGPGEGPAAINGVPAAHSIQLANQAIDSNQDSESDVHPQQRDKH